MAKLKVGLSGLFRRQLEAIRDGLDGIIKELDEIPEKYCKECGGELTIEATRDDLNAVIKRCKDCGEHYAFKKEENHE